jgi:hypothetical protein
MAAKELSGTLRKNKNKKTDAHPDLTGDVTVKGVQYWLSAWVKNGSDGKWVSLALKEKEQQQEPVFGAPLPDDDFPF